MTDHPTDAAPDSRPAPFPWPQPSHCGDCGTVYHFADSSWRSAGDHWQHRCPGHHPQSGHLGIGVMPPPDAPRAGGPGVGLPDEVEAALSYDQGALPPPGVVRRFYRPMPGMDEPSGPVVIVHFGDLWAWAADEATAYARFDEKIRAHLHHLTTENARLAGEVEDYRAALVDAWKNDATRYEYGDRRRGDDARAPAGQRWQTPREIIADFLRSKGRDIWAEIARLALPSASGQEGKP